MKGKLNSTGNQSIKNGYEDMLFLTTINCSQPLFIIEIRGSQSYSLLGGFGSKKNNPPILTGFANDSSPQMGVFS